MNVHMCTSETGDSDMLGLLQSTRHLDSWCGGRQEQLITKTEHFVWPTLETNCPPISRITAG